MKLNTFFYMILRTFLIIALYIFSLATIIAQNLVKNPSFEDATACPEGYGTFKEDVIFWDKPTNGSTDYFRSCGTKMSTAINFIGRQETFDGEAYAGIYVYGPNDYREYITGELHEKLEKGKKYKFSFKLSLAEKSQFAIDEMGILFVSHPLNLSTKKNISFDRLSKSGLKNYVGSTDYRFLTKKDGWMEVSGEYIAKGIEKFIVLGNFKSNRETRRTKVASNLKKASYYYIDMVSIEKLKEPFELNETHVLDDLVFELDGYELPSQSEEQLLELIEHLNQNPTLNVSIFGHTDSVGSKTYNKKLSQKRAEEVGLFLLEKGLEPSRIEWKGFGDLLPMAQNETAEGRQKNRRVEFVLSEESQKFYAAGNFEEDE